MMFAKGGHQSETSPLRVRGGLSSEDNVLPLTLHDSSLPRLSIGLCWKNSRSNYFLLPSAVHGTAKKQTRSTISFSANVSWNCVGNPECMSRLTNEPINSAAAFGCWERCCRGARGAGSERNFSCVESMSVPPKPTLVPTNTGTMILTN